MRFVGASVDALLEFDDANSFGTDVASAASVLLATLNPLGDPFEVPWKLKESLSVLDPWVPADLEMRLLNPGMSVPSNHLEATVLSLAREGGVCLEPLSAADIGRATWRAASDPSRSMGSSKPSPVGHARRG